MNLKTNLKSVLPVALIIGSVPAFAQENATNVRLSNGATKNWDDIVAFLNNNPTSDELQAAVTTAQQALNNVNPGPVKATAPWLKEIITASDKFLAAYNDYIEEGIADDSLTIWYKLTSNSGGYTLYLAFSNVDGYAEAKGCEKATIKQFYDAITSDIAVRNTPIYAVRIYMNPDDPLLHDPVYFVDAYARDNQQDVLVVVNNLLKELAVDPYYQTEQPNPDYLAAQKALADAQTALNEFKENGYDVITLTGDVNVQSSIKDFTGTIIGNGHVFNVPDGGAVFTTFNGTLTHAGVNGEHASLLGKNARYQNVALWYNNVGTIYDATGVADNKKYNTVYELAFAGRVNIGVANGKLAKLADDTRVYNVTVYATPTTAPKYYITSTNGVYTNLSNNQNLPIPDNVFVQSATADLEGNNVFYTGEDGQAKAKKVVVKDGADLFCPVNILADNVDYDREFKVGHATVCLPFAISSENLNAKISTYEKEENGKFWFSFVSGTVEANTPILLTVRTAGKLTGLENITIAKTENQLVEGANSSYGFLKKTNIQEVLGASKQQRVYGLAGDEFMYGGDAAEFPAFRMVVTTNIPSNSAPRRIGLLNEFGEEVDLSGVDNVTTDGAMLEVLGGRGNVTITSSADMGTVPVYTIDGRIAANFKVHAGTNSIDLAKGVYIVMGNKVLVR